MGDIREEIVPNYHRYSTVESTNDLARDLARDGHPEGTVVVAAHQTRGRGRRGRDWLSPAGFGLYISVLLRPEGMAQTLSPRLTLVAAVALREALEETTGLRAGIKWPNDLWISGRKVAGILAEGSPGYVILGIGLNVGQEVPQALREEATSLAREKGEIVDPEIVLRAVTERVLSIYGRWQQDGFGPRVWKQIVEQYRQGSITLGNHVEVITESGSYRGWAEDLEENGHLRVRTETGQVRTVSSDDVSIRPRER